jgi:sugar O-acyltransferase (sialic acid O-acetyltransferase NeuD family)
MLFIGSGGLAAQLFEDLLASNIQDVVFWSEVDTGNDFIKERFKIIGTDEEVIDYFTNTSTSFVMCIGDISHRKKMAEKFIKLGGKQASFITPFCKISPFVKKIGKGVMILNDAELEPGVIVGDQSLLNKKSKYGHACVIGTNCEIAPLAIISAYAEIGDDSLIGIASLILPKVKIGKNVTVSAGSVVTKNIPDNAVVSGSPAIIRFYKKVKPEPAEV